MNGRISLYFDIVVIVKEFVLYMYLYFGMILKLIFNYLFECNVRGVVSFNSYAFSSVKLILM